MPPGLVRERLQAEIRRLYKTKPPGLPAPERTARLAELDKVLLKLERDEERIIVEAERAGVDIERRADADPAAVFGD